MNKSTSILFALAIGFASIAQNSNHYFWNHKAVFTHPPTRIPAPMSVDAPLLGNGYTGVAISGDPEKQIYYVARNDFWRLKSSFNQSFPAVLGKIEIAIPELMNASYRIEQNLYDAKTYSRFTKKELEVIFISYVSAVEDVMILELSVTGTKTVTGSIKLTLPGKLELIDKPPFDVIFEDDRIEGNDGQGTFWISRGFSADVDIPTQSAIALRLLDHSTNTFKLVPGKKIVIVCAFSSNFKSKDCLIDVINKVASIESDDLNNIDKAHQKWWDDFWKMSWVNIPDKTLEKQYYLSNYALASCIRDKDFPPSIFGTWITKERPYWNGDYHLNYNHMAPYYGLYSSNHIEQANPYNAPLLAMIERGKYYSGKVTGIKEGIMLPVGCGPLGMETTRRNALMEKYRHNWIEKGSVEDEGLFFGQKSNSSYCVTNMAMQFYHSYDMEYTKSVYPYVKGVATFWENYLTFEGGRYVIYNDAIHEGTIGTVNPILSLGLVKLVMQTAIDMSNELGLDNERHEKWQHIFDHISDYSFQIKQEKKVFRYSEKGTAWWKNNTLGIQHIYPAGQVGLDSDPELIRVANNTIDVMQRWIDSNGSNSFFPAAVRIGYNPDTILNQLNKYVDHTYPNGFQLDNPHGIENLSTVPNTINEMLCMGHEGIVRVFPVWPKDKDASFSHLRTYGAFLVTSEIKNEKVQFVQIVSEKGRDCKLLNPWKGKDVKLIRNNKETEILSGKVLTIKTSKNESLELIPLNHYK